MSSAPEDATLRRRYARLGWCGLLLLVVLAPVALVTSQRVLTSTYNEPAEWVPSEMPERVYWQHFAEQFRLGDVVLLSWPGATLDSPDLATAAEKIIAREGDRVLSVTTGREIFDTLVDGPAGVPAKIAANRLRGSIVGPDGNQTLLVVSLSELGRRERIALIPRMKRDVAEVVGVEPAIIRAVGKSVEGAVIDGSVADSVRRFSIPSAIIATVLCWICLRSVWLTLAISATAIVGEGLVLGAVLLTGQPMNAVLIVLPPLLFVLTVSAGIHVSNYFLEAAAEHPGQSVEQSTRQALAAGLPPCMLAALTTVIGLGSLVLVPIVPVRNFGLIAAVAVPVMLSLLLLVLPAAMMLTRVHPNSAVASPTRGPNPHRLEMLYRIPVRRPIAVLTVVILLAMVFGWGLQYSKTMVSIPSLFAEDHPMRQDYDWYQQAIGPAVIGELAITFSSPNEDDAIERLQLVNRAHVAIAKSQDVSGVISAGIFLPPVPRRPGIANSLQRTALKSQINKTDQDSELAKTGYHAHVDGDEIWRISFRLPLEAGVSYADRVRAIGDSVQEVIAKANTPARIDATGAIILIETAQNNLLEGLLRSFVTAFMAVAVVMMLVLRSVVGGILAMLPNAFPTLIIFGALGLFGSPLDIGSVMTASVALGIAVDDTVHLLSRYGSRRMRGLGQIEATLGALRQCAPAMAQTTIVCGFSLLVYYLSDFLPTRRFALLMLGLLAAALIGDLLLLPAMLASRLGRWFAPPMLASKEAVVDAD